MTPQQHVSLLGLSGAATGLGIVPSWNFSGNPDVNYHQSNHVTFPPGVDQFTIQPSAFPLRQADLGYAHLRRADLGDTSTTNWGMWAIGGLALLGLGYFVTREPSKKKRK